jgi:CHASE2 domain
VQNMLLEPRLWLQANYRQFTGQLPAEQPAPVLLVQIDADSITEAGLDARKINPIDRVYLAKILDRVQTFNPKVIGIDYLLDQPTPEDDTLQKSVQQAVANQTWLVFVTEEKSQSEARGLTPRIATPNQVLKGYSDALPGYVELLPAHQSCRQKCPFSYLLAMTAALHQPAAGPGDRPLPQPSSDLQQDFRADLVQYWQQFSQPGSQVDFLKHLHLLPITSTSHAWGQDWLHPIQDFSIPPHQVYQRVSADQLLKGSFDTTTLSSRSQPPIILIAPGGYGQAGESRPGEDNFAVPLAIAHWRAQQRSVSEIKSFTGGEALSYMVHHFLQRRLVVPIPDLWMLGLAAIAGKATVLVLKRKRPGKVRAGWFILATAGYGLVCLQLYITPGIVLPWLFPSVLFWVYCLPMVRRNHDAES